MHLTQTPPQRVKTRTIGIILAILVVLAILLALDLRFKGLAWQFFWSQTGEESAIGQLRGMVELGGNLIRPQPDTAPIVPINHTADMPFGMNVFLQKEVEEPKMRVMLDMMREAGFVWLRQEFPWEDIEIDGRGKFTDSRIDRDGDTVLDTVDAWEKYDRIVDLAEEYDFKLLVRLSNPPYWAQTDQTDSLAASLAPPADVQDFVNYAAAVATRYKGRILHYQIWNEPNIYPEWGENFADPQVYTDILCRTYAALKAIDPNIVIVAAALGPTVSLDGYAGYQDVAYLEAMYQAGAADCFDILAAQGYGLFSGPTDRRLRTTSVTSARHVYYRDLMVAHGDADKPIWISEAAWNAVLDADLPADQILDYERFGLATQDQAARYTPLYYQRAAEEWSWVGNVFYWFFTRPDPFDANQSYYYFRMVEPDYQPEKPTFTPLPVYDSMKAYLNNVKANPLLYRGVHQAESWEIAADKQLVSAADAEFGQAVQTNGLSVQVRGTEIAIRWREVNSSAWQSTRVTLSNTTARTRHIQLIGTESLEACSDSQSDTVCVMLPPEILVDSITVLDDTWRNLTPLIAAGFAIAVMVIGVLGSALWKRFRS